MSINHRLSFPVKEKIDLINNSNNTQLSKGKEKTIRSTISNVISIKKIISKSSNYIDPEIERLNTMEKVIKLQEDLKIVASIKQQFEGNQKKMFEKLNKFCLNYYKNKINMKRIFDYCSDKNAEKKYEYNLLTTAQTKQLLEETYDTVFEFMFLIRNNNNVMLTIIENCNSEGYKDISDFLVNFCYEDTINSSFLQEDLLLIIYILIEKCIIKIFPKLEEIKNNSNIYGDYIKQNILYHIFISLTRKADIRNYLCSILPDNIMKLENLRCLLSVDLNSIIKILENKEKEEKKNKFLKENRNATLRPGIYSGNCVYLKRLSQAPSFIESKNSFSINSKLKMESEYNMRNSALLKKINNEDTENNINTKLSFQNTFFTNTDFTLDDNCDKNVDNLDSEKNEKETECKDKIIDNEKNNNDINEIFYSNIENIDTIDPFFEKTETNLEYIKNKLTEYEEHNENDIDVLSIYNNNTIIAMKEYLNHLIEDISSENQKIEKYSNYKLINNLNQDRIKNMPNLNLCINTIMNNHEKIIEIITEFFDIIKENIRELPFFIKCILNIIDILLDYKYDKNLSLYNRYMIKANFFLGNIILPVLENPNYNGIITNEIISNTTKENLVIISSIINVMLTGKLFFKPEEAHMTIFNQFIIETMPMVFEIIQKIEYNIKLPDMIKGLTETIKDIDNENRNINYDYFIENKDEKFHFQSICFSSTMMRFIFNTLINIREKAKSEKKNTMEEKEKIIEKKNEELIKSIEKKKNIEQLIEINLNNEKFWNIIYSKKDKEDFIYMSKMNFKVSFESKIKSILKDNFLGLNPPIEEKFLDEEVLRFKKCLSEMLTYANLIHKEYIPIYIHPKKESYIHNPKIIDLILKNKAKIKYDNIMNDDIYEDIININEDNDKKNIKKEDPNFKTDILPIILLNIKNELGKSKISDSYYQKMLYCCSYIQLHIDILPSKYIEDNYKVLFGELIMETESNIHILRNNIINQLNMKVKGSEKTNMIISNTFYQIKNMEKLKCIEYLYSKLEINSKFIAIYSVVGNNNIKEVQYVEDTSKSNLINLVEYIPDYRKYENGDDDIIDLEEKTHMGDALKNFIKSLKNVIRKENIVKKYSKEDIENICIDLVNYTLIKFYDKLFPLKQSKEDIKFYKKCCRLDFIKPENLIKDKNIVNENMWKTSMKYINEIDNKFTPADKIKCFAKAFSILQNSIAFCSGKNELGVDDTLKPLIYVLLKAKPKNIFSNYKFSLLYLDPDLTKKQYGILLTQIGMIVNIIKDMKHTELIGVTEEQFGKDEE
jgi:hypothetical protein